MDVEQIGDQISRLEEAGGFQDEGGALGQVREEASERRRVGEGRGKR